MLGAYIYERKNPPEPMEWNPFLKFISRSFAGGCFIDHLGNFRSF
jgi:hypothetical protein